MIEFDNIRRVHCVGIGGIGLSAIAEILISRGIVVSGSDTKESEITDRLIEKGALVYLGHRAKNIAGADLIVYSVAVSPENPELVAAKEQGIPIATRAEALGSLMTHSPNGIAVAGAHGKTTATAMISLILRAADKDPTILVGGNLPEIDGNVRVGNDRFFITEACEYMDSFLQLHPKYAVILNIDSDHLDYFKDIDHIVRSFDAFANLVPEDGAVFAFDANPFVGSILKNLKRRFITFGFHENCDFHADEIAFNAEGMPSFCAYEYGEKIGRVRLTVPGEHNVANALAAIACARTIGIEPDVIVRTLESFTGIQRRFDIQGFTTNRVKIVDDYAHHPAEIAATLKAVRNMPHNHLWVIFQPHTYTRTMALHDDFAEALLAADRIIFADIYAARERNIHNVTSRTLAEKVKELDPWKDVWYFEDFEEIARFVLAHAEPSDLVITMGAGDIYKVGGLILDADRMQFFGGEEKWTKSNNSIE